MDALAQRLQTIVHHLLKDEAAAGEVFNAGASEADLTALESILQLELPADFKAVYRCLNGQSDDVGYLFDGEEWLSLERIAEEWQIWKDLYDDQTFSDNGRDQGSEPDDDGIKPVWWSPKWIPFTYDGAGNHLCVDLDPNTTGSRGQIVRMWHDDAERSLEAKSFGEWLRDYVGGMENGDYVYSDEYGAVIHVDDLAALDEDDDDDD